MELVCASLVATKIFVSKQVFTMVRNAFQARTFPVTEEMRWRFRFSILTIIFTIILLCWGAVVTSIEAGLAVPDWPTSFNSMDPLNPIPRWWAIPSILAEHGHRLMGMVVGFSVMILLFWTLIKEPRKWVKNVAVLLFVLVLLQGVLGGLRVVWVSLDLAVLHACVAQLFFSTLVALTFFTSSTWLSAAGVLDEGNETTQLRRIAVMTAMGIYAQIIMGALLRHPGSGAQGLLVITHLLGAFAVVGLVFITVKRARKASPKPSITMLFAHGMSGILALQFVLGIVAYVLISTDAAAGRSVLPTILSTLHMVVGALLLASSILVVLSGVRFRVPSVRPQTASS